MTMPVLMLAPSADGPATFVPNDDELQLLAELDLMAAAVGGPIHLGGGLRLEHLRKGPATGDYAVLNRNLAAILDKFKIAEPARGELLAMVTRFETQVLDR